MKDSENGYHISFFKPTTERARFNRSLVIWLSSIWFIAIFGFHIALRVMEKPTPEPSYIDFESVWDNIIGNNGSANDYRLFTQSTLSVLGKSTISDGERAVVASAMSWSLFSLIPDSLRSEYISEISAFENIRLNKSSIADKEYIDAKRVIIASYSPVAGLSDLDVRTRILPVEITTRQTESLSEEAINTLPSIMEKYLVHNQSVLTDTKFLGFPFHYFYSSVFLLILFIALCWIYCIRSDRRNRILGIED